MYEFTHTDRQTDTDRDIVASAMKQIATKIGPRWVHVLCCHCVTRANVIKAVAKKTYKSKEIYLINSVKLLVKLSKAHSRNKI